MDWDDYELVETIVFENMNMKNKKNMNGSSKLNSNQENSMPNPYAHRTMEEKALNAPKKKEILQQCHVCKQNILASEMTKHLKTCLGDKKRSNAGNTYSTELEQGQ